MTDQLLERIEMLITDDLAFEAFGVIGVCLRPMSKHHILMHDFVDSHHKITGIELTFEEFAFKILKRSKAGSDKGNRGGCIRLNTIWICQLSSSAETIVIIVVITAVR